MAVGGAVLAGTATGIGFGATLAVGAIAGAAGAAASMAVGSVMGQGSFSWRGVAAGAVTGAITAGAGQLIAGADSLNKIVGGVSEGLNTAGRVVQGVTGYGASVVGNATAGLDTGFSWNAVAASAMGAFLSAKLGGRVPLTQGGGMGGNILPDTVGGFIDGASNATARRLMGLGGQDWDGIAVDAFGNALANSTVKAIHLAGETRNFRETATSAQADVFNRAIEAGADREQLLSAFANSEFADFIDRSAGITEEMSMKRFGLPLDKLDESQLADLFDSLYGTVLVGEVQPLMPSAEIAETSISEPVAAPLTSSSGARSGLQPPSLSAGQRVGRGVARLVTEGTESLESVINWIGADNAEAAAIAASIAAGGPIKAAGQFIFDKVAGPSISALKEQLFFDPVSNLASTYIFGAQTSEERMAVSPASDALAQVGGNFAMTAFGIQAAKAGADGIVQNSLGFSLKRDRAAESLAVFDVGPYKDLQRKVPGLDAHHAGQAAHMERLVQNYDRNTAPAILVPREGHTVKSPRTGDTMSRSPINPNTGLPFDNARQLLARDIRELQRMYPDIPRTQLKKLILENKRMYPEMNKAGK
jgi:hypothetical protein